MASYNLTTVQELAADRSRVFPFFADAFNLQRITPPWLRFHVATPAPIDMAAGTRIDYRLRLRGIPIRWTSEITVWEPPYRFVDEQLSGPYREWVHEHTFEETELGCRVADTVRYSAPGGALVHRMLVAGQLREIFTYRHRILAGIFGESVAEPEAVRIAAC